MKLFQQGDVLFHAVKIPKTSLQKIDSSVIQEGEHTGHAHRIVMFRHDDKRTSGFEFLEDPSTKERFLRVGPDGIEISHEEHKTIKVPEGEYKVGIVMEYDHFAEETRRVMD